MADAGIRVDPATCRVRIVALKTTEQRLADLQIEVDASRATLELSASVKYVQEEIARAALDARQLPVFEAILER
ncbi:MAG: hypothetical protein QNJ09_11925 [Paracoccaceae bacterium]|nr:hypothetical protein [Paracoccaceae bacterium]